MIELVSFGGHEKTGQAWYGVPASYIDNKYLRTFNPYTYENQHVNISLDVLPRVNDDKVISMKIDAIVQDIIGYIGDDQRPMISTRSTNTTVRVNNGETLLIGGLIFDTADEMKSKVPVLGDIPLIKNLFNYNNKKKEQRELLIFITPTIISSDV